MSFDKPTRNRLQNMVAASRKLLVEDFTEQLSRDYGMHADGLVLDLNQLHHLDARGIEIGEQLREQLAHFEAVSTAKPADRRRDAYDRLVRELGFTVLNRLAALRMCEERGLIAESVRKGSSSEGFQLFDRIANGAVGDGHETYRLYLELMFDELAVDLRALFDRRHPTSLLFPSEQCLAQLLDELNAKEIRHLWAEDETIGWVYQYWNTEEDRRAARYDAAGKPKAPQNSRDLAIRNQFFTPRYVVQFLTDNTLGRTWYEMRQGRTALADSCSYMVRRPSAVFLAQGEEPLAEDDSADQGLSQEELLRKTVHIPFRASKDPRDIKVLDPACGSGHFLLYAFDLLETIYEEAWEAGDGPASGVTGRTLRQDYADIDKLRRAVPALVMRHNLWGVDIDSRCSQIAALALWLRAQRTYQRLGLKGSERPVITKSNIVCAEPMPGERDMLDEYLLTVDDRLRPLVRTIWEKMQLVGEAGSLLRIEEEIEAALAQAKRKRLVDAPPVKMKLFGPTERQEVMELLASPEEREFWQEAEQKLLMALAEFAAHAGGRDTAQRRLFAEDAAQGFSFIDVYRQRYDVVGMNPPFGQPSRLAKDLLAEAFPRCNDLYAAFIERGLETMPCGGLLGAITSRTGFFQSTFRKWREETLLKDARPVVAADLGADVLDSAMVETAAYCLEKIR